MKLKGLFFALIMMLSMAGNAQMKGQVNRLVGTWRYEGGSGYEVWKMNGDDLKGYGYRSSKFEDTILVEEINIRIVSKRLTYTLMTRQVTSAGTIINEHRFMSKNRKSLRFENMDNDNPRMVEYKLGAFNKNRLKILISFDGKPKPVVLKLRREQ